MRPIVIMLSLILINSCAMEDKAGIVAEKQYNLYQSSDYSYEGKATMQQLPNGKLEVILKLEGPSSTEPYFFTSHLHFGNYDEEGAEIAYVLNPIDIRTLESRTILENLSNGSVLNYEQLLNFDGHIKVHLADDGPDYNVILVAGNIGQNNNALDAFNSSNMEVCSPYFPAR